MDNGVFSKAMRLLARPASVLALATLLVNDHLLRRLWPSWFSGKLGDFAWLFFMPFVAAALIALIAGHRARSRWVGVAACLSIGSVFALAKTIPAAHMAVVATASALFGFPVGWRRDPTDLIALLSVVAAWRLWDADERRQARRTADGAPARVPARAVPLLAMAALLTVGNMASAETGIEEVIPYDGLLVACAEHAVFASVDGGMTWTRLVEPTPIPHPTLPPGITRTPGPPPTPLPTVTLAPGIPTPFPYLDYRFCRDASSGASVIPPAGPTPTETPTPAPGEPTPRPGPTATPEVYVLRGDADNIVYRFQANNRIERSTDGGATWTVELEIAPLTNSQALGLIPLDPTGGWLNPDANARYVPGPRDGAVDPVTGNVVFAMGLEGVLVRDVSGEYWWVSVGEFYRHAPLAGLVDGTLLAGAFGLLALATLVLAAGGASVAMGLLAGLGWLAWTLSAMLLPFTKASAPIAVPVYALVGLAGMLAFLPAAVRLTAEPGLSWRTLARIAATALAAAALVFLPYLLWAAGGLPHSGLAAVAAVTLGVTVLYAGWRWTKR